MGISIITADALATTGVESSSKATLLRGRLVASSILAFTRQERSTEPPKLGFYVAGVLIISDTSTPTICLVT